MSEAPSTPGLGGIEPVMSTAPEIPDLAIRPLGLRIPVH